MNAQLDRRRLLIYLAITFGFTWLIDAVIYLGYGAAAEQSAALPVLLLIVVSMFGPLIGHIGTRLVTREGWRDLGLRPQLRRGWRYWLLVWLLTPLLVVVGAALYFLLFPQHFDPTLAVVQEQLTAIERQTGQPLPLSPPLFALLQLLQGVLLAPLLNAIPILGEEFGWRAYLLPKLLPLGERRAYLLSGLIWGLWHAPLIAMGHNYGTAYAGAPWLGILAMCWFTIIFGTFIGWATLRAGSVWPAVIGHGMVNGVAGAVLLVMKGSPNLLLGPIVAGIVASAGVALVAAVVWWRSSTVGATEHPFRWGVTHE